MKERLEHLISLYKNYLKDERKADARRVLQNVIEDIENILKTT